MKTTARVRANRRNAKRSTGPKSKAGKKRVAQNALRHGLAVPIASLPQIDASVERLARRIAGNGAEADRLELVRPVAEAQIDLNRVRRARTALLAKLMADPDYLDSKNLEAKLIAAVKAISRRPATGSLDDLFASVRGRRAPARSGEAERVSAIIHDISRDLARLDRYERRALSRRRFAVRGFDKLA